MPKRLKEIYEKIEKYKGMVIEAYEKEIEDILSRIDEHEHIK